MAYEEGVAERLRELFMRRAGIIEKLLHGGSAYRLRHSGQQRLRHGALRSCVL
jgi:hypothetical protein